MLNIYYLIALRHVNGSCGVCVRDGSEEGVLVQNPYKKESVKGTGKCLNSRRCERGNKVTQLSQ